MLSDTKISSIRILLNSKSTFNALDEFISFVNTTLKRRGGYYFFPNLMMNSAPNTLVLFQYDSAIWAYGILLDAEKTPMYDEFGKKYAGYYLFDVNSLHILSVPLKKQDIQTIYPKFQNFNQCKQIIPIEYVESVVESLNRNT